MWAPRSRPRPLDGDGRAARKFFNLSERYDWYREYRVDPLGRGLHGMHIAAGEVIRLTQTEVEQHPAWEAFGTQAGSHPPLRGWPRRSAARMPIDAPTGFPGRAASTA